MFTSIPKVELHCHLDGIADAAMLRSMQRAGVPAAVTAEELEAVTPAVDRAGFERWMAAQEPLEGDIDAYRPLLAEHVRRLRAQNVVYSEIMVGSSELSDDAGQMLAHTEAFRTWLNELEDGQLQVELLFALNRNKTPDRIDECVDRALRLHAAGLIVGVAFAGPEEGRPVRPFARSFARLHDAGVPIEIHAGEWAGADSVEDALTHGKPRRIGHGVAIFDDPRLIERVREGGIHIEVCPTSNVCTGAVASIDEHPVRVARDLALDYSINTDDPGPFACTLTGEFEALHNSFGFDEQDALAVARNALGARFAPTLRGAAARLEP